MERKDNTLHKNIKMKEILNIVKRESVTLSNAIRSCEGGEDIAYHNKDLEINGNLDLEYLYENNIVGLYVDGDLKVKGNIFGGTCVFLYVSGDLYVDSFFCTADELVVKIDGDLYVNHFLETYKDAFFEVKGKIKSAIRIHKDHHYYIKDQLENTPICFTNAYLTDIWGKIIDEEKNWKAFKNAYKEHSHADDYDDVECEIDFVLKYWDFYQNLWKKQKLFDRDILKEALGGEIIDIIDQQKDASKIVKKVQDYIEAFRNSKPKESYCKEWLS